MRLKAKKCKLFQQEIFLFSVSAIGIRADPAKCQQVRNWLVPKDLHELWSFIGLNSYYRRHIQGFTQLADPLYELATKGRELEWTARRDEAFEQLRITVRMNNNTVSWLHRNKDPSGQPARWIEVIDTYDIIFQHRSGRKHGNADALSRYPCHQCGGECEGAPPGDPIPVPTGMGGRR